VADAEALAAYGRSLARYLSPDLKVRVQRGAVMLGTRVAGRWTALVRLVQPSPTFQVMTVKSRLGARWGEVDLRGAPDQVGPVLAAELRQLWENRWRAAAGTLSAEDEPPEAAHLAPGSGARGVRHRVGPDLFVVEDTFTEGPCPAASLDEWHRLRARWWIASPMSWSASDIPRERPLVVWAAEQCSERLLLAWTAAMLQPPGEPALWHAQPERWHGRGRPRTVGVVPAPWILAVRPRRLDAAEVELLGEAWTAYSEGDPAAFLALVDDHSDSVVAGLGHLCHRLPHTRTGLTYWEHRMISYIRDHPGTRSAAAISEALLHSERTGRLDLSGEDVLWDWLAELSGAGILDLQGGGESWNSSLALTEVGAAVLEGKRSRLDVAGFDRWFGGTHLRYPAGPLWTWDGTVARLV